MASAHKKGISSHQLSRDLGVTQKTAWFMLMRIREAMKERNPQMLIGITQADETFVGGKNKNRHADKKVELSQGRNVKDKTPVFGLLNNGSVNTQVVVDTKVFTLKPIIRKMVEKGSIIVTDEWGAYNGINSDFQHEVVKHKESNYTTITSFHTNGIEGYWSQFKRAIYGIYHHVSPKHLQRYCNEFSYRFNTRVIKDTNRFSLSLTKINGRLTYKKLIQ